LRNPLEPLARRALASRENPAITPLPLDPGRELNGRTVQAARFCTLIREDRMVRRPVFPPS